jgi:hypothetical protein
VYVKDVAAATEFFVGKYVDERRAGPVQPETFIVSQDHEAANTFADLFRRYRKASGERRAWFGLSAPQWMDRLKDRIKFRRLKIGRPMGALLFSPTKLLSTGFEYRYGIARIEDEVIAEELTS